jgi:hypothetical protein
MLIGDGGDYIWILSSIGLAESSNSNNAKAHRGAGEGIALGAMGWGSIGH